MIKILFVVENLSGGGAERVLVNLVNNMDRSRYDITVLTLFEDGENAGDLGDGIKHISGHFKKFRGIRPLLKLLPKRLLYRHYAGWEYDLAVAFMTGVPTFIVSGAESKKIAWLHGEFFEDKKVYNSGLKRIYDRFDAIAGVSGYVCGSFARAIGSRTGAVTVYNTNDAARIKALAGEAADVPQGRTVITTVGRLVKEKGYVRLVNIMSRLHGEGFEFELFIVGDGNRRAETEEAVAGNDAGRYIHLTGYDPNPYKYVARSGLYICSSYTEGLSTAVTEAVILGIPVVSTAVSGAKEILGENNEYGIVTENTDEALYEGIKRMLADEKLRAHYAEKAKERAAFFDTGSTVAQAERLFEKVLSES